MSRKNIEVLGALYLSIALALAMLPAEAVAQNRQQTECRAIDLETPLLWAVSGAWMGENRILVPDQHRRIVFEVTTAGSQAITLDGHIERGTSGAVDLIQPSTIHSIDGGYLIEDEKQPRSDGNDELYRTDHRLNAGPSSILIKGRNLDEGLTLSTIYGWSPIDSAGRRILAFGDIQGPGSRDWRSAFLILGGNDESEIVYTIQDIDDPVNELYMRSSSYITRLNGNGYILFLDNNNAKIGEVTPGLPGVRNLPSFPVEFSYVASLDRDPSLKSQAHKQVTAQFRKLERSKMPMGIVGWREHLYLIAKESMSDQLETVWKIIKLDPDTGDTLGEFVAPTTAAHIVAVPNQAGKKWALIEKAPVEGKGLRQAPYMHTSSMVVFPGAWLEDSENSPLSGVSAPPECATRH